MHIERHQVGEAAIAAAREDFVNRIGSMVRSMSRADRMATYEWQTISEELLDYLGALSVERPRLDTPEAQAVLKDAAEAAAGAVSYAAYYAYDSFHVFLDYVNFGMSYDRDGDPADRESISLHEWLDAFCLAVIGGDTGRHGEAFHFARQEDQAQYPGRPATELVGGFMAYVCGDLNDDDQDFPPSQEQKLAAIDAGLARIAARALETGDPLLDQPDTTGLRVLRALTAGDREAYGTELVRLLRRHAEQPGAWVRSQPRTLLPLVPIALAALGHRDHGWWPPADSDYLPYALLTGFAKPGPRAGAFGRDRRPDAVAELAGGRTVEFERPLAPQPLTPEGEAGFEESTRKAFTPQDGPELSSWRLASALRYQEILFKTRATHGPDVTDTQLRGLHLASALGAALFRTTLAEPGTEAAVTIEGRTLAYPSYSGHRAGLTEWLTATHLALITGVREDLAPLVLAGPSRLGEGAPAYSAYCRALHAYLRGEGVEEAVEQAVAARQNTAAGAFLPPPVVLLSQLVEGDEESFNLALLDALEAHRDHCAVADRAEDCDAALDLGALALACHARRRGWDIRVASPYLPPRLLQAAAPL
ncbi:immunity 49 family protein [Streptomyces sp. NPDC090445]|uniref:immunity 49 family protein n=1 Tax=Streptomyces sp. NPDC090445 TaxID=3365963 RepID=UPI0037F6A516